MARIVQSSCERRQSINLSPSTFVKCDGAVSPWSLDDHRRCLYTFPCLRPLNPERDLMIVTHCSGSLHAPSCSLPSSSVHLLILSKQPSAKPLFPELAHATTRGFPATSLGRQIFSLSDQMLCPVVGRNPRCSITLDPLLLSHAYFRLLLIKSFSENAERRQVLATL